LTLRPDPEQAGREAAAERQRLDAARAAMSRSDLEALVEATCTLKRLQETPDPPEALATIPTLALEDLPRRNKVIPMEVTRVADTEVLYHDLNTNGVLYLDLGLDLRALPADLLRGLSSSDACSRVRFGAGFVGADAQNVSRRQRLIGSEIPGLL
jgi:presequence protease